MPGTGECSSRKSSIFTKQTLRFHRASCTRFEGWGRLCKGSPSSAQSATARAPKFARRTGAPLIFLKPLLLLTILSRRCKSCHGIRTKTDKKRLSVIVERGMTAGETIILRGEGDESVSVPSALKFSHFLTLSPKQPDSSAPGDLHFTLKLTPHATFTVSPTHPLNLHTTISLTLSESLLGFDRLVLVHLDKRGLRVHQPAPGEKGWRVLKSGDLVVIKGEGLWRKGERGDLICKVEVEMPSADWAAGLSADKVRTFLGLTCTLCGAHDLPTFTD